MKSRGFFFLNKGVFRNYDPISTSQKGCRLFHGCWEDFWVSSFLRGYHLIKESRFHQVKIMVVHSNSCVKVLSAHTHTHLPLGHTKYYSLLCSVRACIKDSLTVFYILGCVNPVGTTGSLKNHLPIFFLLPPIYGWSLEYRSLLHCPNWIFLKILL